MLAYRKQRQLDSQTVPHKLTRTSYGIQDNEDHVVLPAGRLQKPETELKIRIKLILFEARPIVFLLHKKKKNIFFF